MSEREPSSESPNRRHRSHLRPQCEECNDARARVIRRVGYASWRAVQLLSTVFVYFFVCLALFAAVHVTSDRAPASPRTLRARVPHPRVSLRLRPARRFALRLRGNLHPVHRVTCVSSFYPVARQVTPFDPSPPPSRLTHGSTSSALQPACVPSAHHGAGAGPSPRRPVGKF